jgi:hypothetical protein
MYAVLFWMVLVTSILFIIGTFIVLIRRKSLTVFDCLLFILPFAVWIALTYTWNHPKSLSNLIELFALIPILSTLFLARAFLTIGWSNRKKSCVAFSIAIFAATALYAFVPLLPE